MRSDELAEKMREIHGITPELIREYCKVEDENTANYKKDKTAVKKVNAARAKMDEYAKSIREGAAIYVGLKVFFKKAEGSVTLKPGPSFQPK